MKKNCVKFQKTNQMEQGNSYRNKTTCNIFFLKKQNCSHDLFKLFCISMAFRNIFSQLKKAIVFSFLVVIIIMNTVMTQISSGRVDIFISTQFGNDINNSSNDGAFEHPYKTIRYVQKRLRKLRQENNG